MGNRRKTASFVITAALVYLTVVGFSVARVGERRALRRPTASDAGRASTATERDFHVGASFTYELRAARVLASEGGQTISRTKIDGRLALVIVSATNESVKVRAQLSGAETEALSAPFLVVIARDGAIASFVFSERTPEDARRRLEAVVSSLQLVASDRPFDASWERVESDGVGRYVAAYDRTSGRIEKTKLRYELVRTPEGLVPPHAIGRRDEVRSAIAIGIDASGWPSSVAEAEIVVTTFEGRRVTTTTRTELRLLATEHRGTSSFDAASAMLEQDR